MKKITLRLLVVGVMVAGACSTVMADNAGNGQRQTSDDIFKKAATDGAIWERAAAIARQHGIHMEISNSACISTIGIEGVESLQEVLKRIRDNSEWQCFERVCHDRGFGIRFRKIGDMSPVKFIQTEKKGGESYQENLSLQDYIGKVPDKILEVKDYLKNTTMQQIYKRHNLTPPRGVVLHGLPGTGKTYLVRCLAGELRVPCIMINSPELLGQYVHETEAAIIEKFKQARLLAGAHGSKTAMLCFDEFDTIGSCRGSGASGNSMLINNKIVNALLTSIDGFRTDDAHLVVIACTNRIDMLDPALIRSGRLETHIEVLPPDQEARQKLLLYHLKKYNVLHASDSSIASDVKNIAQKFEGKSAADIGFDIQRAVRTIIHRKAQATRSSQVAHWLLAKDALSEYVNAREVLQEVASAQKLPEEHAVIKKMVSSATAR